MNKQLWVHFSLPMSAVVRAVPRLGLGLPFGSKDKAPEPSPAASQGIHLQEAGIWSAEDTRTKALLCCK